MSTHGVRDRMRVFGPEGEFLGFVDAVGATHFELSPGALHPMVDYDVPKTAVREISRGRVFLREGLEHFASLHDDEGSCVPPHREFTEDREGHPDVPVR